MMMRSFRQKGRRRYGQGSIPERHDDRGNPSGDPASDAFLVASVPLTSWHRSVARYGGRQAQLVTSANRVTASAFLVAPIKAVPCKIPTTLTENGIRFRYPHYAHGPTAKHMTPMFGMRCRENGIEHRFTKINHPWTTGQVERIVPKRLREARGKQGRDRQAPSRR
ncbi:MAG: hypothetical protein IOC56_11910 [Methylobacterium sp.]|nr:hypothetical protein [Methylobacterium sp.]MCA3619119.1 hypothetical protein [Methylobacterium sp.]MCA3621781.1 hypothetical protein [Methylobacterium sp.]